MFTDPKDYCLQGKKQLRSHFLVFIIIMDRAIIGNRKMCPRVREILGMSKRCRVSPYTVSAIGSDGVDENALHNERLKVLGTLAANIGHEFNNIVQVMSNSIEIASRESVSDKQKRNLERVAWGFEQARTLAKQMLALARKQDQVSSIFDLNQVIRDFDKIIEQIVRRCVKLQFEFHPDTLNIQANRGQLELAVLNLIKNASDAISDRGTITIKTSIANDLVELDIIDDGCGMDDDIITNMFKPFFTTKLETGGTGLGLPMVLEFMVQSGGTVDVRSTPNIGTTIKLLFPKYYSG